MKTPDEKVDATDALKKKLLGKSGADKVVLMEIQEKLAKLEQKSFDL